MDIDGKTLFIFFEVPIEDISCYQWLNKKKEIHDKNLMSSNMLVYFEID